MTTADREALIRGLTAFAGAADAFTRNVTDRDSA